jgi:hypothetical protein
VLTDNDGPGARSGRGAKCDQRHDPPIVGGAWESTCIVIVHLRKRICGSLVMVFGKSAPSGGNNDTGNAATRGFCARPHSTLAGRGRALGRRRLGGAPTPALTMTPKVR